MTVRSTISHDEPPGSIHSSGVVGVTPSGNVCLKTIGALTGAFPTFEIEKYQIGSCPGLTVCADCRSRWSAGAAAEAGAAVTEETATQRISPASRPRTRGIA